MVSTLVMMLGSIEYVDTWVQPHVDGTLSFVNLNFIVLIIFICLMPILLINLLVSNVRIDQPFAEL